MSRPQRSRRLRRLGSGALWPSWRAREDDESYTCVITHVAGDGGGSVRKRVYFGFGDGGGWLVEADDEVPAPAPDFLSRCCLCDKRLDGLDIYMYRCVCTVFVHLISYY